VLNPPGFVVQGKNFSKPYNVRPFVRCDRAS